MAAIWYVPLTYTLLETYGRVKPSSKGPEDVCALMVPTLSCSVWLAPILAVSRLGMIGPLVLTLKLRCWQGGRVGENALRAFRDSSRKRNSYEPWKAPVPPR